MRVSFGAPRLTIITANYQLARQLRADAKHADMRLIALTGFGQPSDVVKARRAGFDEHDLKPVDLPMVEGIIEGAAARTD